MYGIEDSIIAENSFYLFKRSTKFHDAMPPLISQRGSVGARGVNMNYRAISRTFISVFMLTFYLISQYDVSLKTSGFTMLWRTHS